MVVLEVVQALPASLMQSVWISSAPVKMDCDVFEVDAVKRVMEAYRMYAAETRKQIAPVSGMPVTMGV